MIPFVVIGLPLIFAILCGLVPMRQRIWLSLFGGVTHLLYSSWLVQQTNGGNLFLAQSGGWARPFGIEFQIDALTSLMIWISSFLSVGVQIYELHFTSSRDSAYSESLRHFLLLGVFGAFCTADLFNLFVWFEVLLLASFALLTIQAEQRQLQSGIQYVLLNLTGSGIFLLGLAFLYNSSGTLNFNDLRQLEGQVSPAIGFTSVCLVIAFGIKAALVPVQSWLPASYPYLKISMLALFSGLLTKVGVYTLLRFFATESPLRAEWTSSLLFILAMATMLIGVLGAIQEKSIRKILSFHIISQIGYMILGIASGSTIGIAACIFYLMHHMIVKTNLFMIAGAVEETMGTSELQKIGGLHRKRPLLSIYFLVSALSLAGLPLLSGFWAKAAVIYSAFSHSSILGIWSGAVALLVGLLTLFSMVKIWNEAFLKPAPQGCEEGNSNSPFLMIPILVFCFWTLALGFFPKALMDLCIQAAQSLKVLTK